MGEGFRIRGTHVYLWPIHANVWQKPSQYYKVIILQLKYINQFKKNTNSPEAPPLGNFPCVVMSVSSQPVPEYMCKTLLLEMPLPCVIHPASLG